MSDNGDCNCDQSLRLAAELAEAYRQLGRVSDRAQALLLVATEEVDAARARVARLTAEMATAKKKLIEFASELEKRGLVVWSRGPGVEDERGDS